MRGHDREELNSEGILHQTQEQHIFELKGEKKITKKRAKEAGQLVMQTTMLSSSIIALAKAAELCVFIPPLAITALIALAASIIIFMLYKYSEHKIDQQLVREKSTINRINRYQFFYPDQELMNDNRWQSKKLEPVKI